MAHKILDKGPTSKGERKSHRKRRERAHQRHRNVSLLDLFSRVRHKKWVRLQVSLKHKIMIEPVFGAIFYQK
jgi:hypothetical protein